MIRWQHALAATTRFRVDISRDAGMSWQVLQSGVTTRGGKGAVAWTVTGPATEGGLVRVVSLAGGGENDVINSFFSISEPFVRWASITAGQDWGIGTQRRITWTHNLGTAERVHIDISRDDGLSWSALAAGVPLRGTESSAFQWRVTGPPTDAARLRVRWSRDDRVTSVSSRFSISPPFLRLTTPIAGGTIYPCSNFTPVWRHNLGTHEPVTLELSLNGGEAWRELWWLKGPGMSRGTITLHEFVQPPTDNAFVRVRWSRDPSIQATTGPLRILSLPDYPYCD
jgi:hypothetical protein